MANPSKVTGTKPESAVVAVAHSLGIPARRVALAGIYDQGDVHLWDGRVVVEVKSRKKLHSPTDLQRWWQETTTEATRVLNADMQLLVVKRPGSGLPMAADWWAYVAIDELHYWMTYENAPAWTTTRGVPACWPLGTLLAMLKEAA